MADDLFEGLPPPSANPPPSSASELQERKPPQEALKPQQKRKIATFNTDSPSSPAPAPAPPPPKPILKSALKRPKPSESNAEEGNSFFISPLFVIAWLQNPLFYLCSLIIFPRAAKKCF